MSDSEENRSGASSALLNIASAYSDSDSSQETNEDFKSPKSLGGLIENLRAEVKKPDCEVTKVSEGLGRTNSGVAGHAGDVEKSQPVTKIVRLDSGKVVKISTSPGSKASEVRQEESHPKQTSVAEVVNSFRSPDIILPDQQSSNDHLPNNEGSKSFGTIHSKSPTPETFESSKVEPILEKALVGENKSCKVNQNADLVKDIEVGSGNSNNGKECLLIHSEVNIISTKSADINEDISAESGNTEHFQSMGGKHSKESVKVGDEGDVESRGEESVRELAEALYRDSKNSEDKVLHIKKASDIFQGSSSSQDLNITQNEEPSNADPNTESNILNAYLKSKIETQEAEEPETECNGKYTVESEINENRFQSTELEEIETLTTAGSVADHSIVDRMEEDVEIVILDPNENSCSGNDEETSTSNPDIFEVKPRPELKSTSRLEKVKTRPSVAVVESCDADQSASESDVKKTTASGPVKLKRNFGVISAAASEQQEKRFRSDNDLLPDITILPSSPEMLDSVRSPPKTQTSKPSQSSLPSTFQQEPYQTAFGKINTSPTQSFQSLKKSPQSVPQVSQRVTRREENKRTLPLILRKAEISSSKRESAKLEDSSSKVSPKKEEVYSNVSSVNSEVGGILMGGVSSESREQSMSVPFSSSSSNQDASNPEGIDFGNVISGKETKVPPLTGDSGSDNAMSAPTEGEETKEPTSFLSEPTPPVEIPAIVVPKKRGRPRKFPLPETGTTGGSWPTPDKSKATPKTGKRRKSGKVKADKDAVDETPKKRCLPRYKKKKKPGESDEPEITRSFNKKGRMEVMTEGCKPVTVNQITEYFWPPVSSLPAGEKPEGLMIQEQISEYLGVKSFKRKYPSIKRRPVDMEERNYLQENGYVSENMCDMGLTAVYSADIIEIMYNDFPHKFEEYRKHTREKKIKEQKALREKQAAENMDPRKEALESTVSWNTEFNKTRLFRVLHLMEEKWLETQGLPVSPFEKVLVVHAPVNVPLCVETSFWENSLFSPECEISVHCTLSLKKEYEATNQWIFVVGYLK